MSRRGGLIGLWLLPGLWLCGGLLCILPQHGGAGAALPQNLLAWSVMALMAFCATLSAPRGNLALPPGSLMMGTGLLLWSLPLLWSWRPDWFMNALPRVAGLWGLVALYYMLLRALPGMRVRRYWMLVLVLAALLQAGLALKQSAHPELLAGGRPTGGVMQVNVLSSFLATGLACALFLCFRDRGAGTRLLTGIALCVLPAMVVVLQSRAGALGSLATALILLWVNRTEAVYTGCRPPRRAVLLMLLGVSAGLFWLWAGHRLFPGSGLSLVDKEGSTASRLYMLNLSWQLISAHPLIGNGYGGFEALFGHLAQGIPPGLEADTVTHPHNELLLAWGEGGLTAVAGLLLMVLAVLRRLWGKDGSGLSGLALLLPLALHMNLEFPLYLSVSHGMMLVLVLVSAGPDAFPMQRVALESDDKNRASRCLAAMMCWIPVIPAAGILLFMVTGLVTQQRLMAVERAGLIPLADNEESVLASLPNPYILHSRIAFDRHVALLLRYNRTRDESLLVEFQLWAQRYLQTHNDPGVYRSLMQIGRARGQSDVEALCRQAHGRWPANPGFVCDGTQP